LNFLAIFFVVDPAREKGKITMPVGLLCARFLKPSERGGGAGIRL
jgi:hypothetical protein